MTSHEGFEGDDVAASKVARPQGGITNTGSEEREQIYYERCMYSKSRLDQDRKETDKNR